MSLIDICIQFERISLFKPWLEKYFKKKPYLVSFICFLFGVLALIPLYLSADMRDESDFKNALLDYEKLRSFVYCKPNVFTAAFYGRILIILSTIIRDILFLIIEIISTFISLYYLKLFFKKKKKIMNKSVPTSINSITKMSNRIMSSSNDGSINRNNTIHVCQKRNSNKTSSSIKSSRKITIMSLAVATVSLVCKISSLAFSISFIFNNQFSHNYIVLLNVLAALLKAISSFFIFMTLD